MNEKISEEINDFLTEKGYISKKIIETKEVKEKVVNDWGKETGEEKTIEINTEVMVVDKLDEKEINLLLKIEQVSLLKKIFPKIKTLNNIAIFWTIVWIISGAIWFLIWATKGWRF